MVAQLRNFPDQGFKILEFQKNDSKHETNMGHNTSIVNQRSMATEHEGCPVPASQLQHSVLESVKIDSDEDMQNKMLEMPGPPSSDMAKSSSSGSRTPNSGPWSSGASSNGGGPSSTKNSCSVSSLQRQRVKVFVRMRPFHEHEKICPLRQLLCLDGNTIVAKEHVYRGKGGPLQFNLDYVQDDSFLQINKKDKREESQRHIFETVGKPAIENALDGFNTTIIAYGQMGSGKTYTMTGDGTQEGRGLVPRLAKELMQRLEEEHEHGICKIEVSYLEIYQEKVRDLLAAGNNCREENLSKELMRDYEDNESCKNEGTSVLSLTDHEANTRDIRDANEKYRHSFAQHRQFSSLYFGNSYKDKMEFLKVREHPIKGPYVEGLLWKEVSTWFDLEKLMKKGAAKRTTVYTDVYKNASRSHTLFTIKIIRRTMSGNAITHINLVDLAGSEKLQQTIPADRRDESRHINRSLTLLNEVILSLSKRNFVSYRNSALTWLLKDSLGGNSKTFLVASISPAEQDFHESISTLRYASKANRIESILTVNDESKKKLICKVNEELHTLNCLVTSLKDNIAGRSSSTDCML